MPQFLRRWLPVVGLAILIALVLWKLRPPRPRPAAAPATEFAAARTVADLDSLAWQPHPLGSLANDQVRSYLLRRLRALGLQPRVQDTTLLLAVGGQTVLGRVRNVVAQLPGRQPAGKAVLVLAHYDSQPHTPGAGDDAAGVAAALETLRALRTGPALANSVIWLFTDGEELGLLGARAFAADSARLRRRVGVALNFEGRGNSGPSLLFEVSRGNGWLLREFAKAVPAPLTSSLFYEAYRRLPNGTDFTPLRQAGVPGLNFSLVEGYSYYHSPADTPGRFSLASMQHHGSYMLSLVRHFGNAPLTVTTEPDYTFFSVLNAFVVRYPATWSLPLVAVAALLLALVATVAQQQRRLAWNGLLGGALGWLLGAGLLLALGWGLLLAVRALYPQYLAFYGGTFYNVLTYQVALLALGLAGWGWYYGLLSKWLRFDTLVGGALLAVLLLAGVLAWVAPTSAYLLTWPLLAATLAWGLGQLGAAGPMPGQFSALADWLLSIPLALVLVPVLYLLLPVFGLSTLVLATMPVLAVTLGLLLPLLLPVLRQPGRARPAATGRPRLALSSALPLLSLAVAGGALVWGQLTSQPSAERPQQVDLYYYLDATTRQAHWLSGQRQADAWTSAVLPAAAVGAPPAKLPGQPARWAPAPTLAVVAPKAHVLADTVLGGRRRLRLLLQGGLPGGSLQLTQAASESNSVLALRVAGQPVPPSLLVMPGGLLLLGLPTATVEAELAPTAPLRLSLLSRTLGLPANSGLTPLPAAYVPAPNYNSFTTQVRQQISLAPPPPRQAPAPAPAQPGLAPLAPRPGYFRPGAHAIAPAIGKPATVSRGPVPVRPAATSGPRPRAAASRPATPAAGKPW